LLSRLTKPALVAAAAVLVAGAAPGSADSARHATAQAAAPALAPPVFRQTLSVGLVSGTVIITPPGGRAFRLGVQDRDIPIGSLINTDRGRIDLRAAPPPGSGPAHDSAAKVEDAQFYEGSFRVSQSVASPVTTVRLVGGRFSVCSATTSPSRDPAGRAVAATVPRRIIRQLGASGSGRFRTRGRYAAATVRGTLWFTKDYCNGTLVQVKRGVVSVDDLVRHRTVNVTAGHSYFAAAP
jgi:hypothetical protein